MADRKSWWRIEVNASGKVVDCRVVEHADADGSHVFYVRASNQKEAGREAWNAYCRAVMRARRVKLKAENKCRCGRPNDREPGKRCTICLEADKTYGKRARERAAGKKVEPLNRQDALQRRRAEEQQRAVEQTKPSVRLQVLLEVQEAWQNASNNAAFTRWLNAEIEKLTGRRVA